MADPLQLLAQNFIVPKLERPGVVGVKRQQPMISVPRGVSVIDINRLGELSQARRMLGSMTGDGAGNPMGDRLAAEGARRMPPRFSFGQAGGRGRRAF